MDKWPFRLVLFVVPALIFLEASHPLSGEAADRLVTSAQSVLQAKLLEPLQRKEANRSRFSRAVSAPQTRRIRILDETPQTDRGGRPFLAFTIDETRSLGPEARWFKDAITGCVYPESGEVLVRRGEVYYASSVLLGPHPDGPGRCLPAPVKKERAWNQSLGAEDMVGAISGSKFPWI
jgi:hypothetical protein